MTNGTPRFGVPALAGSVSGRTQPRPIADPVPSISNFQFSIFNLQFNSRIPLVVGVLLLVLLFFTAPSHSAELPSNTPPKKLRIVTTIFPIYCFASAVAGSEGEVQNLLPPNVGPHDYQLSPSDIRKIKDADIVIMNGLGLDDWIKKALDPSKSRRLIVLGDLIPKDQLIVTPPDLDLEGAHKHGHEHEHAPANPHIWLDPQLAIVCVSNIAKTVSAQNPACQKNADAYIARLHQLDSDIAAQLAPIRHKPFITQHDAFPYFVRHYQLKQVGILEPTPDVPPSPRFLADLLKVIHEKNVAVIFNDPRSLPRLAKQIAHDAKIRTAELDTLESGKLDPNGYEQGMRRNAKILATELK